MPRSWYFPTGAPRILIATGDAHKTPPDAVEEAMRRVEQRGEWFSYPATDGVSPSPIAS